MLFSTPITTNFLLIYLERNYPFMGNDAKIHFPRYRRANTDPKKRKKTFLLLHFSLTNQEIYKNHYHRNVRIMRKDWRGQGNMKM